jgi:hypothetical protein
LIKTTATSNNSAVSRLIRLIEEAQTNRSETEKVRFYFRSIMQLVDLSFERLLIVILFCTDCRFLCKDLHSYRDVACIFHVYHPLGVWERDRNILGSEWINHHGALLCFTVLYPVIHHTYNSRFTVS